MRKLIQSDLVGKTIKSFDNTAVNCVKITFEDGSNLELYAEEALFVCGGYIPGIFVYDETDDNEGDV